MNCDAAVRNAVAVTREATCLWNGCCSMIKCGSSGSETGLTLIGCGVTQCKLIKAPLSKTSAQVVAMSRRHAWAFEDMVMILAAIHFVCRVWDRYQVFTRRPRKLLEAGSHTDELAGVSVSTTGFSPSSSGDGEAEESSDSHKPILASSNQSVRFARCCAF